MEDKGNSVKVDLESVRPVALASTMARLFTKVYRPEIPVVGWNEREDVRDLITDLFMTMYNNPPYVDKDKAIDMNRLGNFAVLTLAKSGLDLAQTRGNILATRAAMRTIVPLIQSSQFYKEAMELQKQIEQLREELSKSSSEKGKKKKDDKDKEKEKNEKKGGKSSQEKQEEREDEDQKKDSGGSSGEDSEEDNEENQSFGSGQGDEDEDEGDGSGQGDEDEDEGDGEGQGDEDEDEESEEEKTIRKSIELLQEKLEQSLTPTDPQKAVSRNAAKKANDDARNINAIVKAWGQDPGSISPLDADEILNATRSGSFNALATLIGRARGMAKNMVVSAKNAFVTNTSIYATTKKLTRVTASNKMYMFSGVVPKQLRTTKKVQFLETGLFGTIPVEENQIRGHTVVVVDESGSMGSEGCKAEKALALGLCQAIKSDLEIDRHYELIGFSYGHTDSSGKIDPETFSRVKSTDGFIEHIKWASSYMNGGTDFDSAIEHALDIIDNTKDKDAYDLVMFSDGICYLSNDMQERLDRFRTKDGGKFIYIQIGSYSSPSLKDHTDVYIEIPDARMVLDGEQILKTIVDEIVKSYLEKRVGIS